MKKTKLTISKALKFKIHEDGNLYGFVSYNQGEFYIAPEIFVILSFFSKSKSIQNLQDITKYLNKYFQDVLSNIPDQEECEKIIADLIEFGFLVSSDKDENNNESPFSDPWIQWAMLADSVRSMGYEKAISKSVNKSSVVLDVGAGTGFLSACALFYGAKKVYAIEETKIAESILPLLKKLNLIKNKNSFKLYACNSFDVDNMSDVNLVMSELFGNDPFSEGLFATLQNATQKLKNKNVKFIPEKLQIFAEIIDLHEHPVKSRIEAYQKQSQFEEKKGTDFYSKFLKKAFNHIGFDSISFPIALLKNQFSRKSVPLNIGECSLDPIECNEVLFSKKFYGRKKLEIKSRDITTPLVLVWFRVNLTSEISLSSHPYEEDFASHWSPIAIVLKENPCNELFLKYKLSESLNNFLCEVLSNNKIIGRR